MLALIFAVALATPPLADHVVVDPDWAARPSADDLAKAYPERALDEGVEGRATIECFVMQTGLLTSCRVLSEDPPAYGFGEAALSMADSFRMRPLLVDGKPVAGGRVRVPLLFKFPKAVLQVPPARLPALEAAGRCYGLEAAASEANMADAWSQRFAVSFMAIFSIGAVEAGLRPSEMEARLVAARLAAAAEPDSAEKRKAKADCDDIIRGIYTRPGSAATPPD